MHTASMDILEVGFGGKSKTNLPPHTYFLVLFLG